MKHLIFDFDGTLADSLDMVVGIFRELTGVNTSLTADQVKVMRKMPAGKLAKTLGIPLWKAPFLLWRGRRIMHRRIDEVGIFEGLAPAIIELHKRGYTMRIVSSNSEANIVSFLERHQLREYFVSIRGGVGLFSKGSVLRSLVRKAGLDKKDVCYIGDEARDIEASRKAGIKVVSVAWGYNDAELLHDMRPHAIADEPADLLQIFK